MAKGQIFGIGVIILLINSAASLRPVNLGNCSRYVVFSHSSMHTRGATLVIGDIGVARGVASTITGFQPKTLSLDGTYSTNERKVLGKIFAADYNYPTPLELNYAVSDFIVAYMDAAGRPYPDFQDVGYPPGHMNGGRTLTEGLYNYRMPLITGGTIILQGTETSVFIFQVNGTIQFNGDTNIVLIGGTLPQNVFWQASGQVVLTPSAIVKGIILGGEGVIFQSMASLHGRAFAGSFVKLVGATILGP